jgi:hypothetical protein
MSQLLVPEFLDAPVMPGRPPLGSRIDGDRDSSDAVHAASMAAGRRRGRNPARRSGPESLALDVIATLQVLGVV